MEQWNNGTMEGINSKVQLAKKELEVIEISITLFT